MLKRHRMTYNRYIHTDRISTIQLASAGLAQFQPSELPSHSTDVWYAYNHFLIGLHLCRCNKYSLKCMWMWKLILCGPFNHSCQGCCDCVSWFNCNDWVETGINGLARLTTLLSRWDLLDTSVRPYKRCLRGCCCEELSWTKASLSMYIQIAW